MRKSEKKYALKEFKSMTFMDDFLYLFLLKNRRCLYEILRIILKRRDFTIIRSHVEYFVKNIYGRSIIFDVYITIRGKGMPVHIDLEIQKDIYAAPEGRLHYYRSLLDACSSRRGQRYENIDNNLSIWIMGKDYFGTGHPYDFLGPAIYGTDKQPKDLHGIIVVNGEYVGDDEIAVLVHDLKCADPEDMINPVFRREMYKLKRTEEGRIEMTERLEKIVRDNERRAVEKERRIAKRNTERAVESQKMNYLRSMTEKGITLDNALYLLGIPKKDKKKYISLL